VKGVAGGGLIGGLGVCRGWLSGLANALPFHSTSQLAGLGVSGGGPSLGAVLDTG
jgi:hypothetical protein